MIGIKLLRVNVSKLLSESSLPMRGGGVISTVKQTIKQIVPIDINTKIPKSLLLLFSSS